MSCRRRYNLSMRRLLLTAALLILATLPVCAQRFAAGGRVGFGAGHRGGAAIRINPGFGFRSGIGFGHNPGFGVFFGSRPFHRRFFFGSGFYPYGLYPYTLYPYYGLGLQSDFVYSGSYSQPSSDYLAERDVRLQNDVYRLEAELDQMRREQARRAEEQQYVSPGLMQAPRSSQAAKPEPPAQPTVLVYRDGHKVEVHNYAIAGQTLWIFSEERARKVPLADLNLDATRQANEERGVDFSVHAAPAR